MPEDPNEPHIHPTQPGERRERDETRELIGDTHREIWDRSRPDALSADDRHAYEEADRERHMSRATAQDMMRADRDLGQGEPLRAAEDELPTHGAVSPEQYEERPYWALAWLVVGGATLIASILGLLMILPFMFGGPPAAFGVGGPWVVAAFVSVLAGLAAGLYVWPRDHYGTVWAPLAMAAFVGVLVTLGVLAFVWYLAAVFLA